MAGAELLALVDQEAASFEVRLDLRLGRRDDHRHVMDAGDLAGVQDQVDHGTTAQRLQDFRPSGAHTRTQAGR